MSRWHICFLLGAWVLAVACVSENAAWGQNKAKKNKSELDSEFAAARRLESLCVFADFFGEPDLLAGTETEWENGKLTREDKNGKSHKVPITEAMLECESLNAKLIGEILKLKHLRTLSIQFSSLQDVDFPIQELKWLEKLELENTSEKEIAIPKNWAKNIGALPALRTLQIPDSPELLQEAAKMEKLQSLTVTSLRDEPILPRILPLKNSLRELVLMSEQEPQAGEILKQFTRLQVLSLDCADFENKNLDSFLREIHGLPLRCLWLAEGQIGQDGVDVLLSWDSLQEVMLPKGFSEELFSLLEKEEISVSLSQKDGSRREQRMKKFFRASSSEKMHRDYRLDAQGNYIHWAELHGGIFLLK